MSESEVKIKITGDAKSAESAFGKVKNAIDKTVGAVNNVKGAIAKMIGALGIVGFAIDGVRKLWEGFQKVREWMIRAETAARKLRQELEKANYEHYISTTTEAYKKLNSEIERTNRLEKERNQIIDGRKSKERDIEDARLEINKANEIAQLDPMAEDYADKKKAIENKYARKASEVSAGRAAEDARSEAGRLNGEANSMDKQAAKIEKLADKMYRLSDATTEQLSAIRSGRVSASPERVQELEGREREYYKRYKDYSAQSSRMREDADSLRRQAAEKLGGGYVANLRNQATQAQITQSEKEDAANKAKEEAKKKAEEEKKEQAKLAREKAKKEAEEQRKVLKEKGDKASQLDTFADRLAATNGVSQNRLTAMGLGSGVTPRQSQIASDVKQLVKLMKDEIEATKNIATDGDATTTYTE